MRRRVTGENVRNGLIYDRVRARNFGIFQNGIGWPRDLCARRLAVVYYINSPAPAVLLLIYLYKYNMKKT